MAKCTKNGAYGQLFELKQNKYYSRAQGELRSKRGQVGTVTIKGALSYPLYRAAPVCNLGYPYSIANIE
ncbi:MAG: hypothetical protein GY712_09835 [Oceanicoccus sp.]|uniref:hypothetical protein n=1 Tax=Oceanicoccus sp. TaxID=2691044 RepID=UPI00261CB91C|nr:hypothetical protein [Oceanicoccus sp.]MCP3908303.1 hypothetical protein [Oceanicoccus sp.]MDG1772620.1 hypothetical protein [Oceanicoccus sp.]